MRPYATGGTSDIADLADERLPQKSSNISIMIRENGAVA